MDNLCRLIGGQHLYTFILVCDPRALAPRLLCLDMIVQFPTNPWVGGEQEFCINAKNIARKHAQERVEISLFARK